jgi:hypothetical protein
MKSRVADLFQIKKRFLRSINLERDFHDPSALEGYVQTEFIAECFSRIMEGVKTGSRHRAWRMTGDYGSGKSSFALVLAHAFARNESNIPPALRRMTDFGGKGGTRPGFLPVLVIGSRQGIGAAMLHAIQKTLRQVYKKPSKSNPVDTVSNLLRKGNATDEEIVGAVCKINADLIADGKAQGLLIIIDELGKFLEFAALHPQSHDVFLLQSLSEAASRSGDEPLFVVCLLHQGFNAYADTMSQSAQKEWEKIAGRFEEILFNQPTQEIAHIIASALNVNVSKIPKRKTDLQRRAMEETVDLGWLGRVDCHEIRSLAPRLFPLHPTVLPVLIRLFRRFGQNERSMFSFLFSNEPFGLQAFSDISIDQSRPYCLYNLYDYVRANFGHRIATQSYRTNWNLIDGVIESYSTDDPLTLQILKTVGVLNLLNDTFVPSENAVSCALGLHEPNGQRSIKSALQKLRVGKGGKGALYDRGRSRGLCLWPHTSVDLEKAFDEARRAVPVPSRVAPLITAYLETRPIVARRHYIKTGNLRYYEVIYCPVAQLLGVLEKNEFEADGYIIVPLCETAEEQNVALEFVKQPGIKARINWLVAVSAPLNHLTNLMQEVQRCEWVITNTPELNGDKYGREEASRKLQMARMQLENRIDELLGFKQLDARTTLQWFHKGAPVRFESGRNLLKILSKIFDDTYHAAPRIHNELVNRHSLSSAAAAARMRLIGQIFTASTDEWLGINPAKAPPERSIYLSVLRNTGIHRQCGSTWRLTEPRPEMDKKCNVIPAFEQISRMLRQKADVRVGVPEIFSELRKPPFGVRQGLIPLFLTAFARIHEQEVAFYKDGTFLREMTGGDMLLLTKNPNRFEVQYCKIEGVRTELFQKLVSVLEVTPKEDHKIELLDIVKALCSFVAQLPPYVHHTKRLSQTALAVRDTILNAHEPGPLIFNDLPTACGFESFSASTRVNEQVAGFVKSLRSALDELRAAYPELQERMRKLLRDAFDLPGTFPEFRSALAERAEHVIVAVNEPKLRAFCFRLIDNNLPESEWLESLGSFLSLKPPAKWHDAEADFFGQELAPLSTRFHRVESIIFSDGKPSVTGRAVRLAITQANGTEHERVIHFSSEEEEELIRLQKQFEQLLSQEKRLGLAAASRAIWTNLEKTAKPIS